MVFALLALGFAANQVAVGLAVGVLGQGLSSLFGKPYESQTIAAVDGGGHPFLSDIPLLGPSLFTRILVVYATLLLALAIWFMLNRTTARPCHPVSGGKPACGPVARFLGSRDPDGCRRLWRALSGLAGAYASTVYTPLWATA